MPSTKKLILSLYKNGYHVSVIPQPQCPTCKDCKLYVDSYLRPRIYAIFIMFSLLFCNGNSQTYCKICKKRLGKDNMNSIHAKLTHIFDFHSNVDRGNVALSSMERHNNITLLNTTANMISGKYKKRTDTYYCRISNKFLAAESFTERFLFLSHHQSDDECKRLYEFAENEFYEFSWVDYKKFIRENMVFDCIFCGNEFDVFPSEDVFLSHFYSCIGAFASPTFTSY